MEFSNMLERCKLSKIADYLLTGDVICDEENHTDYESEIRNMEAETEKLLEKYFPDTEEQEEIYNEISRREMLVKNIYFQFGLIAGLNISGQIEGRAAELGQQPQLHYFSVPGKKSATVPGPTCEPVTGS